MDMETMRYYVSTGLWPADRLDNLYKKKRLTEEQYNELKGLLPQ